MNIIFTRKLFVISILLLVVSSSISGPGEDKLYNSSVNAIGYITDRSGSTASGFFINENTVVTNNHVSEDLDVSSAVIEMKNGSSYRIKKIMKEYPGIDLAILRTEDNSPYTLKLEDFEVPRTNDIVYSIGNPTDEDDHIYFYKMTKGRIKFIGDDDWFYEEESEDMHNAVLIQHTAMIRPGNSGGPLLNENGKVIGVNTFFYDDSLNYAIHIDELLSILRKNRLTFNESENITETNKKSHEKNVDKKFEQLSDKNNYYYRKYYFLFLSGIVLYYMFVIFGILSIFVYLTVRRNKKLLL